MSRSFLRFNWSWKYSQWAVLVLSVSLSGLIGFMIVSNYRSQIKIQNAAFDQIKAELTRQTAGIGFFFADRLKELNDLSIRREIQTFFENKALGMTMDYGLKASLYDIQEMLKQLQDGQKIGGESVYSRLTFLDDQGKVLVDTKEGILPAAVLEEVTPYSFYGSEDARILFTPLPDDSASPGAGGIVPVFYKKMYVGQIRSWVSINNVFFHLAKHNHEAPYHCHFFYTDRRIFPENEILKDFPDSTLDLIDKASLTKNDFFQFDFLYLNHLKMLILGSRIPHTPFYLIEGLPQKDVYHGMLPWQLMMLLGALAILVISGLISVWFLSSKSLALQIHLNESARREAAIQEKHHQLEKEVEFRTRVEESLRKSENKFKELFDNINDFIYTHDLHGRFLTANPAVGRMLGLKPLEVISRSIIEFMPPDQREIYHTSFFPEIMSSGSHHGIFPIIDAHGKRHLIEYTSFLVRENGEAAYIRGSGHDITEAKKAENSLREHREHLKTIMDSIRAGIVLIDRDSYEIVDANSYTLEKIQTSLDEIKGKPCQNYFSYDSDICPFDQCSESSCNTEGVLTDRRGEKIPVMKTVIPIFRDGRTILLESFIDISESKRHELELMRLKEAAEATSRELAQSNEELNQAIEMANQMVLETEMATTAKTRFLANVSHEIRTPLNAIIGMVEVLEDTELTQEQQKYVKIFKSSGENLLNTINDLLDFSKIDAGHLRLENIEFNLKELMNDMGAMLQVQCQNKGLEFGWSMDSRIPDKLRGDPIRLKQILMNLTGNALKFTMQGSITISIQSKSPEKPSGSLSKLPPLLLEFSVRDTGIGIPEDKLQSIFDAFSQVDVSVTRRFGGTGLGLSISKKLAELMGGSFQAFSQIGQGSDFRFTAQFQTISGSILQETADTPLKARFSICDAAIRTATPHLEDEPKKLPPQRILVVDDVEHNQILIDAFLKSPDWLLSFAGNGQEAVEHYRSRPVDLILMDMQMPVMDGYTATQTIRHLETSENRRKIPIVALTAHAFSEEIKKCLASGCDAHLSKPVRKEILLTTLNQLLTVFSVELSCPAPESETPLQNAFELLPLTDEEEENEAPETATASDIPVVVDPDLEVLIPGFLQSIRDQIPHLSALLQDNNFADIKKIGHSLKGVGGGYGFDKITELGARMERSAADAQHAEIETAVAELTDYLTRVKIITRTV